MVFTILLTSSKGNQDKIKIDNKWYKFDALGYEAASEVVASYILSNSNICNFVEYLPCRLDNQTGCVSNDFNKQLLDTITIERLIKAITGSTSNKILRNKPVKEKIKYIVDLVSIKGFPEYLTAMLEFDSLILNEDRHFHNILLFRKSDNSFEITPIFDNGAAFLSDIRNDYPLNHGIYGMIASVKSKPFTTNFDKQVEACRELYGSQLRISKDLDITVPLKELKRLYATNILQRIEDIFNYQKNLNEDLFYDKVLKEESIGNIKTCIPDITKEYYGNTEYEQAWNFFKQNRELFKDDFIF